MHWKPAGSYAVGAGADLAEIQDEEGIAPELHKWKRYWLDEETYAKVKSSFGEPGCSCHAGVELMLDDSTRKVHRGTGSVEFLHGQVAAYGQSLDQSYVLPSVDFLTSLTLVQSISRNFTLSCPSSICRPLNREMQLPSYSRA